MSKEIKPHVLTHADLVMRARRWLSGTGGCGLVLTEMRADVVCQEPDAIGWRNNGNSVLVECKVSRADFLADKRKFHNTANYSMGAYRFYLTPAGLVQPSEVPYPWGLLEIHGARVHQIHRPLDRQTAIHPPERAWRAELILLMRMAQARSKSALRNIREQDPDNRDASLELAAIVADGETSKSPIIAPLTNAAWDECARTIAANIRDLKGRAL